MTGLSAMIGIPLLQRLQKTATSSRNYNDNRELQLLHLVQSRMGCGDIPPFQFINAKLGTEWSEPAVICSPDYRVVGRFIPISGQRVVCLLYL